MSLPKPYYSHAGQTIYHGDCREILGELPKVDLVLTDPPYGIDWVGHNGSDRDWSAGIANDSGDLDLRFMLNLECDIVTFGANCYPNQLPHRGRWLVWDKRVDPKCDAMLGSPVELAWTNRTSGFDWICRVQHGGVVNADRTGKRVHPTQKPVSLMGFCLEKYPNAQTILDPFMGSGTTLVAAKQLGRQGIGIELEERYCQIAAERLSQEVLPLFDDPNVVSNGGHRGLF